MSRFLDPRWQGDPRNAFGHGWEFAAPLVTSERVPDRRRKLEAMGNGLIPQVALEIFRAIDAAEREARP